MRLLAYLILALLTVAAAAQAAPPPPRPYSGCGVLLTRPSDGPAGSAPVYAEPGLQRIAELEVAALPKLPGSLQEPRLAVVATRGAWLRIAYDDAGREGWIDPPRSWEYRPWRDYLPGRSVRVLPGLKKVLYQLRREPREGGAEIGSLSRDQQVRVLRVEEDWALVQEPAGWFRWRDGDGRLTVVP